MTARPHSCGKARFATGAAARRELARIRRTPARDDDGERPCREYACPACGGFHLTSSPADPGPTLRPLRTRRRPAPYSLVDTDRRPRTTRRGTT